MVRKAWFQVLLALVLVALGLTAGAPSSAQEVTLRFNRWGPPTHHIWARMMSGWIEQVEKVSQGRVKIEFTPASLGPPHDPRARFRR